jgi:uncharacterized protein YeaO (DUF488 family)
MSIKTKRWDDPVEADDGTRILICRYRPRGVRKEDESWDEWLPDLGPSAELHSAAYGKRGNPIAWSTYRKLYRREMGAQHAVIRSLADRVRKGEHMTLLCSSACTREARCHRSLLRELIEAELGDEKKPPMHADERR